jgi:hypothetical protein
MTSPTRIALRDGSTVFTATLHRELQRVIASARRRGDDTIRINGRVLALDRITDILAPWEHA